MELKKHIINPFDVDSEISFSSFYNTYYKRFVRYAFYYVNEQQTAEDMTHDALLYYWENKNKLSPETDVLGYILLSVKNKCLNHLKHLQVEAEYNQKETNLYGWEVDARITTLEDESYSSIFTKDMMDIITTSLSALPLQTQKIFILNHFKNRSRKEIATLLGVSLQKIDYHINKANDHLYKQLKDYIPLFLLILKISSK
ncbi:MAG: RNA polymerase sigma-70 factor [Bacteroidales bacterium]